jgi:soluble lytic murein transglycosylase
MQVTPRAAGLAGPGQAASPRAIAVLLDPKKNVAYGTRILGANLRRFGGRVVPAIASYNADIRKVRHWYRHRGKMKQDEFIEMIPYLETRQYVKKVLAGYMAYSQLHRRKNIAGLW